MAGLILRIPEGGEGRMTLCKKCYHEIRYLDGNWIHIEIDHREHCNCNDILVNAPSSKKENK